MYVEAQRIYGEATFSWSWDNLFGLRLRNNPRNSKWVSLSLLGVRVVLGIARKDAPHAGAPRQRVLDHEYRQAA